MTLGARGMSALYFFRGPFEGVFVGGVLHVLLTRSVDGLTGHHIASVRDLVGEVIQSTNVCRTPQIDFGNGVPKLTICCFFIG